MVTQSSLQKNSKPSQPLPRPERILLRNYFHVINFPIDIFQYFSAILLENERRHKTRCKLIFFHNKIPLVSLYELYSRRNSFKVFFSLEYYTVILLEDKKMQKKYIYLIPSIHVFCLHHNLIDGILLESNYYI